MLLGIIGSSSSVRFVATRLGYIVFGKLSRETGRQWQDVLQFGRTDGYI
jgi:hypothetical protein